MLFRILISLLMAVMLSLASCKQPQGPAPSDEPDTARSVIQAVVNMNNITIQSLFVKNSDTLSNGKISRREVDNTWSVREGDIVKSSIYALNFKTAITISAIYNSNLNLTPYLNGSNRLDSLRSWDRISFGFQFRIPENFSSGFTFTANTSSTSETLTVLEWIQSRGYERELPSTVLAP
jgi:hypothetical protein